MVSDEDTRYTMGFSAIGCTSIFIAFNLLIAMALSYKSISELLLRKWQKWSDKSGSKKASAEITVEAKM